MVELPVLVQCEAAPQPTAGGLRGGRLHCKNGADLIPWVLALAATDWAPRFFGQGDERTRSPFSGIFQPTQQIGRQLPLAANMFGAFRITNSLSGGLLW